MFILLFLNDCYLVSDCKNVNSRKPHFERGVYNFLQAVNAAPGPDLPYIVNAGFSRFVFRGEWAKPGSHTQAKATLYTHAGWQAPAKHAWNLGFVCKGNTHTGRQQLHCFFFVMLPPPQPNPPPPPRNLSQLSLFFVVVSVANISRLEKQPLA